jgi:hypothetical protein
MVLPVMFIRVRLFAKAVGAPAPIHLARRAPGLRLLYITSQEEPERSRQMPGPDDSDPFKTASDLYSLEQTVVELTRLRGPDHPEALRSRAQLANRRLQAGDVQRALSDYQALLPDLVRALGRETATLDVGTTLLTGDAQARHAIADYERRVQELLSRLGATYSPLM